MKDNNSRLAMVIALLASAGSWVSSASSDALKSAPAQFGAAQAIPDPYRVLLTRSIFSRDGRAAPERSSNPWSSRAATQASTQPATASAILDPEAGFVLRGVGMQDGIFSAFFEQTSQSKGISRGIGENIARGQIMAMSLDGVDYACQGKVTHVLIGQDLMGRDLSGGTSTAAVSGGDWRSKWHHPAETPATPPQERGGDRSRANRERGRSDGPRPTGDPNFKPEAKVADAATSAPGPQSRPAATDNDPSPYDSDPN